MYVAKLTTTTIFKAIGMIDINIMIWVATPIIFMLTLAWIMASIYREPWARGAKMDTSGIQWVTCLAYLAYFIGWFLTMG